MIATEQTNLAAVSLLSEARFTKRICFSNPQVLVFVLTFAPGQELPKHRHPGSTLVVHVTGGSGVVVADGRETPVAAGDILLVEGEEEFAVRNTGSEALVLLASLSPNPSDPRYAQPVG
ncbi:cupin domain-containing protein [Symbiobacterium thermophilum]|uniref:cupin domain-containing protein n=1 Tax=Symbiobacterium thermophilum TaxID=2734 RepID=UPI0018D41308|nr:cupin domain-containing protein [Symbiobacterium thermophilum]